MTGNRRSPSFWIAAFRQVRLAWRLFWDARVPLLPKLLPLATLAYIFSPLDFLPDVVVGLGQLDDLALFLLSIQVFPALCPRSLVDRILDEMSGRVIDGEWRRADAGPSTPRELPPSDR